MPLSSASSAPQLIGGRYRLREQIGHGGMGTVWRAYDELLGRLVAVKEVLPPPGLPPEEQAHLRERTLDEARAAARSSSRAAVTVHDVVEQDDRPWIVMELLEARSLVEVLREQGPLPPALVARIGLAVLDALEAAHRNGVIHRDVKPGNVLLCADGRILLTDFGVAALDGQPSEATTTPSRGMVLGTPAYLAPERLRGAAVTPAVDLWSLGATLYAALTGSSPFQRLDTSATLRAVLVEPAPPPPAQAGELAPVLRGLLTRDAQQRLNVSSARALLERAAAGAAAPDPPAAVPTEPDQLATAVPPAPPATDPSVPVAIPDPTSQTQALRPSVVLRAPADRSRWRSRRVLLLALLIVVAVLGIAVGRWAWPHLGTGPGVSTSGTPTIGSSTPTPKVTYGTYRDPSGFAVDVPEGWLATRQPGGRVDFAEPGSGRFLSISQTDDPVADPVQDWRQQEPVVKTRLTDYRSLGIRPVQYREWSAADWDFTWRPDQTGRLRVRNRNIVVSPDRGYALYFSVPEDQWDASEEVFATIAASFQPAT